MASAIRTPDDGKRLFRYFQFDRAKIDKEKRTVEVAFSSEEPVERWGYTEILDHSQGSVDLSRMKNSGAFLLDHDPRNQIGVVESATVGDDKKGRAIVRFSKSAAAEAVFQDVMDGIRPHISVGYERTAAISKTPKDGAKDHDIIRFAFMPYEISSVAIPADTTVGVGRSEPATEQNPNHQNRMSTPATPETAAPDRAQIIKDLRAEENKRTAAIRASSAALLKMYPTGEAKLRELTDEAIAGESTPEAFGQKLLSEMSNIAPKVNREIGPELSEQDQSRYSILRGIQAVLKNGKPEGIERELSDEMVLRTGKDCSYSGFVVPPTIAVNTRSASTGARMAQSIQGRRDLNVTTASQGGDFVPTMLITPIIELLRNKVVLNRLGIQTMSGLSGNVAIPRQTGAATAYSVAESAALTESTQAINQVSLTPHRVGAYNEYTKQLLLQSSVDVENFIRDDLMKVIAIKLDYLGLQGSGSASQPTGVLNTASVGTITFGAAATYAKMVSMETSLAAANADMGRMAYITDATSRGVLKSAAKLLVGATTVTAVPIWDGNMGDGSTDGIVNGYRAAATNQVDNHLAFFGNWEELILGMWGGFDVVVNPYALDINAEVRITINTFIDYAVRHAQSFCVSTDSAAQ